MRIAIYGAGAMGTVLGAFLTKNGVSVDLISHNISHVSALKKTGAHITGTVDFVQPVSALTPEDMVGKYDLIFLMTKQRENLSICRFLKEYLSENGVIVTTQNGLPEEGISTIIGKDNTYGCVTVWGATFVGNGESKLTSSPTAMTFQLGCYGQADERIHAISSILCLVGRVEIEPNLLGARWAKLTVNGAFSGASTISGLTFGEVAKHPVGKWIVLQIIQECNLVAKACGITPTKVQGHDLSKLFSCDTPFKRAFVAAILPIAIRKHKQLVSSMLMALKSGKLCEIDYINGAVSNFGKKCGVATPVCDGVCAIAHEIERGETTIGVSNFDRLIQFCR